MYDSFPWNPIITQSLPRILEILNNVMQTLDNPVNDDAVIGMYKVFALAKAVGCTAVFDGEAADELFFTGHVHSERRYQKYLIVPYVIRKLLLGSLITKKPIGSGLTDRVLRFLFNMGQATQNAGSWCCPVFIGLQGRY